MITAYPFAASRARTRTPSAWAEARAALANDPVRRLIVWYLLLVIAILPLPFGGWRDWAIDILGLATAAMLAWLAWALWAGRTQLPAATGQLIVPIALYAGVILWALVQTDTSSLTRGLHHPLWAQAETALGRPLDSSISLDRYETHRGLVSLMAYGGIFLLALHAAADIRVARLLVRWIVYTGASYALYGLVIYFAGVNTILWFEKEAYRNVLTSTFDNRNNFATYAGMALIAATGLFLNEVSRQRQDKMETPRLVVVERVWTATWPLVVAMGILAAALLLTASRAGAVTTLIGLGVLVALIFATKSIRPFKPRTMVIGLFVLAAAALWLAGGDTAERIFLTLDAEEERWSVFAATLNAIRDHAWTGTGLGTFEDAFRLYRTPDIENRFAQAHSDVLENAMELGVIAVVGMLAALCLVSANGIRSLCEGKRGTILLCISLSSSAQIATHSIMDFGLQVPATAMTYALLLGAVAGGALMPGRLKPVMAGAEKAAGFLKAGPDQQVARLPAN